MTVGRRGFTLLELVVAAAWVAAASVVVAGAFAAGLRIFERARQADGYGETVLVLEMMQKDLHNAVPFRLAGFRGDRSSMEIPLVVRRQESRSVEDYLGTVTYERGGNGQTLDRITTVYVSPDHPETFRETLMASLDGVSFTFAESGPDQNAAVSWTESWTNPTNLPAAVRIVIASKPNGEPLELSRTVVISRR